MKLFYPFLISLILVSCYITKSLDKDVHIVLEENIPITIINNGNSNFTAAGNDNDYTTKFMEGIKSEFSSSKVIPDGINPEFKVIITELKITESTSTETVNDTTSEQNGTTYELTKLEYNAKGLITRIKDNKEYTWSATKDKEETVTSNRSVIQMATGQNKEQNVYREKDFSPDEAISLTWNIGRRSGTSVVKEIIRALK